MKDRNQTRNQKNRPNNLKINGNLPIRAVGVETKREQKNYSDKPPQNYLHTWFARRPIPATRLAILASVLPDSVADNQLLKWMGMNPDNLQEGRDISTHIREKQKTVDQADGRIYDHYGYRKAYKNIPGDDELNNFHTQVRGMWGGELPTVLDATAGGGSIPFESRRYNLPTIANELNPVPSVILKAILEHPQINGDLSEDIQKWGDKINEYAQNKLDEYYPEQTGQDTLEYVWMHEVTCPDCGSQVPLTLNWWLERESSSEGMAVKPEETTSGIELAIVELPNDVNKSEFDPSNGTVTRGKAECLSCNITIEGEEIKKQ